MKQGVLNRKNGIYILWNVIKSDSVKNGKRGDWMEDKLERNIWMGAYKIEFSV